MKGRRKQKLIESVLKSLPPPKEGKYPYIRYDAEIPGFGVRVSRSTETPDGTKKVFVLNYSLGGVERRFIIGPLGVHSAVSARKEAIRLRQLILNGVDPIEQKKREQEEREQEERSQHTVAHLAADYLEWAKPRKRASSLYNDRGMLNNNILPAFRTRLVASITKRDIDLLMQNVKKHMPDGTQKLAPYRANRIRSLLRKMFNLAIEWDWIEKNPVKGAFQYPEERHEVFLTEQQLKQLEKAMKGYEKAHPGQDAANSIRLLIETGSRLKEVLGARWEQFDLKRKVWTKPADATKEKSEEHVPLSDRAVVILKGMQAKDPASPFLFPGHGTGRARVTMRRAWIAICRDAGLAKDVPIKGKRGRMLSRWVPWAPQKNQPLRIHDLRHTFASHLVSNGVSLPIIGALLGHKRPDTTARYAHVNDEATRAAANQFGNREFGKAS